MQKTDHKPNSMACKTINPSLMEIAYCIYFEEGMVASQKEFSTCVLGMGPSYYSSMRARRRTPKRTVLQRLLKHTRLFLFSCQGNPYIGQPNSVRLNKAHRRLNALANTIEQELILHWSLNQLGSELSDVSDIST